MTNDSVSYQSEVKYLRAALQEILDMGCPIGREGDPLAAVQRIASEALSGRRGKADGKQYSPS